MSVDAVHALGIEEWEVHRQILGNGKLLKQFQAMILSCSASQIVSLREYTNATVPLLFGRASMF